MDKRNLLLALALIAPIIAVILISQSAPDGKMTQTPNRLPATDNKTRPDTQENTPKTPPKNLDEARERLKKEAERLDRMTPEQWLEEQQKREKKKRWWDSLSAEEKLRIIEQSPSKPTETSQEMPAPQKDD